MRATIFHLVSIIAFTICSLNLLAQDHDDYLAAENFYKEKKFEKCQEKLERVLQNKSVYVDTTVAASYKLKGDLFLKEFDVKNTLAMYALADKIYEQYEGQFVHQRLVLANKSGICYAQQDNLIMTAQFFQKEYDIAIQNYDADNLTVGKSTNNLAAVYLYLGDYEKSLEYFFKSEKIKKKFENENPIPLANTYENISTIYGQINQMGEAERYLQKAGLLYKRDTSAGKEDLFAYYLNTAGFYIESEQINVALDELNKAEELPKSSKSNKLGVLVHQKLYGDAYFIDKNYDKALGYYQEAERLIKRYNVGQKEQGVIHTQMADIFAKKNDNQKAINSLEIARKEMQELYGTAHSNYLNLIQKQVYILLRLEEIDRAEDLVANFKESLAVRNELLANDLLFSSLKMGFLSTDLNLALVTYKKNKSRSNLDQAIANSETVLRFQDEVLRNISDRENRLYFFQNAYENFSASVFLLLEKAELTQDRKYIEDAFMVAENAKFYTLQEEREVNFPAIESAVSPDLINTEKELKLELNQKLSKYETSLDAQVDPNDMLSLISEIDSLRLAHQSAISALTDQSPSLRNYLSKRKDLDLSKVRAKLTSLDRTYVSYFLSSNDLVNENFAFVLTGERIKFINLDVDQKELEKSISDLNRALQLNLKPSSDNKLDDYKHSAIALYQALIAPLDLNTGQGLIINGHRELYSIPYEVLWSEDTNTFLLESQSIAYESGVQALLDTRTLKYNQDILSCAPAFDKSANLSFLPLENSRKEISAIESVLGLSSGELVGSKEEFLENVEENEYNIIHLATHASANQQKGYQSFLAFGNSTDDLLYSREIYGLPIRSNLVVLSACETGDGELVKGRGILGLTSAFAASAQSVVASLWKVNDASSQKIMTKYYEGLYSGLPKDEALRNAKLNYITSVPKSKRHPYFWAGFVQYGSVSPLVFVDNKQQAKWLGLLIFCFFIFGLVLYWRKTKAAL